MATDTAVKTSQKRATYMTAEAQVRTNKLVQEGKNAAEIVNILHEEGFSTSIKIIHVRNYLRRVLARLQATTSTEVAESGLGIVEEPDTEVL